MRRLANVGNGRLEAMRRTVVDDLDVQAKRSRGAITQRVALDWTDVRPATAVNIPCATANSVCDPARLNRSLMVSGSVNAAREDDVGRRAPSATDRHLLGEGSRFSLSYLTHFSRVEILTIFSVFCAPPRQNGPAMNRTGQWYSALIRTLCPTGCFARSIPIFL